MVMNNAQKVILLVTAFVSVACAGARDQSRVEPLLFLPHQREIALAIGASERPPVPSIMATCSSGRAGRCDHVSVRYDAVLAAPSTTIADRNYVIGLLLGVSDYNCSSFIARAFGRKASSHAMNTVLTNVSNTVAARQNKSSTLSDALKFVDLFGSTTNGIASDLSQTGAVEISSEAAIGDERRKVRKEITDRAREGVDTYSLLSALVDLAAYDETCSLQRGKELVTQATAAAARERELQAIRAIQQLPPPPPSQTVTSSLVH
jgi:hypothetical protein